MTPRKLYHFETLLVTLLLSPGVFAQTYKPQVDAGSVPAQMAAPGMGTSMPGRIPGQPVILPVIPNSQPTAAQEQESQALQNAFQQFMNSMNGAGGRSEFGNPDYNSGDSYGGGHNHGGTGSSTPVGANDLSGPRKIIPPFRKYFAECTKKYGDCKFENWGIMGDSAHRARRSCHNAGEAIDVGPITCSGGQKISPKGANSEDFFNIAKCMANDSNNELQVIFHRAAGPNMMQKGDHSGHMHVQLKNCNMIYGQ